MIVTFHIYILQRTAHVYTAHPPIATNRAKNQTIIWVMHPEPCSHIIEKGAGYAKVVLWATLQFAVQVERMPVLWLLHMYMHM